MNSLVSVIIPVHNREKYIIRSIKSVLNQTYKELEIIVVDDASTDKTAELIREIYDKDVCVSLIRNSYKIGANASRNKGINIARGKYIAFQDSDDMWYPNKLEKQMELLNEEKSDFIYCRVKRKHLSSGKEYIFPKDKLDLSKDITYQFLHSCMAMTPSIVVKKACFDEVPLTADMMRFQEWDFVIEMSMKYKISFYDEVLMEANVLDDSVSSDMSMGLKYISMLYDKHKMLIDKYPQIHSEFLQRKARYMVGLDIDATDTYKEALLLAYDKELERKYILCKYNEQIKLKQEFGG